MKFTLLFAVGAGAVTLALFPNPGETYPVPDRLGICYSFRDNQEEAAQPETAQPCVINTRTGGGSHSALLFWPSGVRTEIVMFNACAGNFDYDERGYCRYTVNNAEAIVYYRDLFWGITNTPNRDSLPCYQIAETSDSFCYRVQPFSSYQEAN